MCRIVELVSKQQVKAVAKCAKKRDAEGAKGCGGALNLPNSLLDMGHGDV